MSKAALSGRRFLGARLHFRQALILIVFAFLGFLVWRPALRIDFIGDDFNWLTLDMPRAFLLPHPYRPLGHTLLYLAVQLFGDSASLGLHILGMILHAINSYLLFRLGRALTGNTPVSLLAAVIWLASPTAVEPVCWIGALIFYLPMTALFFLVLLLSYHRFKLMVTDKPTLEASPSLKLGLCIAILWGCSLLFHELAMVAPLLVFLVFYSSVFLPRPKVNLTTQLLLWLPVLVVGGAYGIVRIALHAPSQLLSFTTSQRAAWVPYAVWRSFLPTERVIWHFVHFVGNLHAIVALAVVILFLFAMLAILWHRRTCRPIAWGLVAIIVAALPPIVFSSTGGRYLYLSSAMGVLTLALVCSTALEKMPKANYSILKDKHARDLPRIALLGLFLALLGTNLWRTREEIQGWLETSQLVRRMQSQITELVSSSVIAKYADTEPIPILLLDFPAGTLGLAGVNWTIHQAIPELAHSLQITRIYLNDHNPELSQYGFRRYTRAQEIIEMKSSAIVLVFCEQEGAIFLLGSTSVPCLAGSEFPQELAP